MTGSGKLFRYSFLYFALYALFGVLLKVFQGPLGQTDIEFIVYSTAGSALVCLGVILGGKWWRATWTSHELLYISAAGTFTAFVIPTTKLMYSLPISVMVAMILMRGSIIVISRLVDSALLAQGISNKAVGWEENLAVLFALAAVGLNVIYAKSEDFEFLRSRAALVILAVYLVSYAMRIYLMNYFKFTRKSHGAGANNKNYFAVEQLVASVWIFGFVGLGFLFPVPGTVAVVSAITTPHPLWFWALLCGIPFGVGAFFSAFLFLFEGRTSTFAGLANRLSSLLAGTASTLLFALFFGGHWPKGEDWFSLALILVAVGLLTKAEMRRA